MKFPIYRPRGIDPPAVTDDIKRIWDEQIKPQQENMTNVDRRYSTRMFDKTKNLETLSVRSGGSRMSNGSSYILRKVGVKSLSKLDGVKNDRAIWQNPDSRKFVKRERFNEDQESVIQEQKQKMAQKKNTLTK